MTTDLSKLDITELASLISAKFQQRGITAILVGGACATIYSDQRYRSFDLDYVAYDGNTTVDSALQELGFYREDRMYRHDKTPFLVDLVVPPVAIGSTIITQFTRIKTQYGDLILLSPTDCVKDRLASFYYWNDRQGLEQALYQSQKISSHISPSP
ncbi:MAG: hypothetical protein AB7F31_03965 [Parachlamydiales bacterium]